MPDIKFYRILEYLSREDADRAVKELDGKDLRGRPVRVALDDTVSYRVCLGSYSRTHNKTQACWPRQLSPR